MTEGYRNYLVIYLGLVSNSDPSLEITEPKVWLRLAKTPPYGEGLADKGFEYTNCFFPHFNPVHCPKILRNRTIKQCDLLELLPKGSCCRLRCTSEAINSFF